MKKSFILPALALSVLLFAGFAQPAHAAYTESEIKITQYGSDWLVNLFDGSLFWPGAYTTSSVDGSYAQCAGGANVWVDADPNTGYPDGFFDHPDYYCSGSGHWYYYGGPAPQPVIPYVVANPGAGGDYVCLGPSGSCALLPVIIFPIAAYTYSTQACTADGSNACGAASGTGTWDYQTNSCDVTDSPSTPADYDGDCSSAKNACGYTNPGKIECDGSCSATVPAPPAGYDTGCTVSNSCGMEATGTIGCTGVCSASAPADSLCPSTGPAGDTNPSNGSNPGDSTSPGSGNGTGSQTSGTLAAPSPTISASPPRVYPSASDNATISWQVSGADSCSITKNGVSWKGSIVLVGGAANSSAPDAVSKQSVYMITCENGGGTGSDSVTVTVVPTFTEF